MSSRLETGRNERKELEADGFPDTSGARGEAVVSVEDPLPQNTTGNNFTLSVPDKNPLL